MKGLNMKAKPEKIDLGALQRQYQAAHRAAKAANERVHKALASQDRASEALTRAKAQLVNASRAVLG